MTNNISNYTRKQNIKRIINKIITKTLDIILYPLRLAYSKYDGSDLQKKRLIKTIYKKIMRNIYNELLYEDEIYITDFKVDQGYMCSNIISMGQGTYQLQYHTNKSTEIIFDEIEDILRADESLVVESVLVKDVFKYGCHKEDGRVIKVMIIDKERIIR